MRKSRRRSGGPFKLESSEGETLRSKMLRNRGKSALKLFLDRRHDGDERQTGRGSDQAIFNGRSTRLILQEMHELAHIHLRLILSWTVPWPLLSRLHTIGREPM